MDEKSATRHKAHQAEQHASHDNAAQEQHLAPAEEPLYPTSLLGDSHLNERGNEPARVALMQQAQQTYGNRALQRRLSGQGRAKSSTQRAVQRWQASRQERANLQPSGTTEAAEAVGRSISGQPAESMSIPVTPIQRMVKKYQDETKNKDMEGLAGTLSGNVDTAKGIVDSNPLLTGVPNRDKGYLDAWVTAFTDFTKDKDGNVPQFFYARYGYAIETLATGMFMSADHKGYKVSTQVTQGSTRPDFVILKGSTEIAWLDVTSSASVGHIYNKQGGGWKTRPYVAEILYDMPAATDFAKTAKGSLSEEQLTALKNAGASRAQRELNFDKGMKAMGILLGEAYAAAREEKGDGLSKGDVKEVTVETVKKHLDKLVDKGVSPKWAAGVLASIDSIEVTGEINTGLSWANWAFGAGYAERATGRALLADLGKSLG
jgi:hypothetical protein